ncbi:hypothetical protein [Zongyangia hominis]|uniref:DUF2116 family Zn-ribbon domain-containing protein n=1 Tax=Zongyangia hominis TaxID=2763677 RepID=A0A926EFE7_9FIRM|nr:hypothetical protein [Zongyangia hominis]MBC8571071.1 hypothetical protein [Zongyangia hominis]
MPKCVYCNKEIGDGPALHLDHDGGFCCGEDCKREATRYLATEKKYKHWYFLLLIGALMAWCVSFFFGIQQYVGGALAVLCGLVTILSPFVPQMMEDILGIARGQRVCIYVGALLVVTGILSVVK